LQRFFFSLPTYSAKRLKQAEGDSVLSRDQARAMLQTLLADRFNLQFHREMKEMPIYALVVSKKGHKLKDNSSNVEPTLRMMGGRNGMELTSIAGSIDQLVNQLSNANGVDRPVLDRTELAGKYDYKLNWTPGLGVRGNDSETISVFTALQDQLGLRLDPQRGSS
jgi:bla regulator protein BlaR1